MTPERHAKIKDVFLAACELPSEQRGDFLHRSCGEDSELRAQVEKLLEHHAQSEARPPGRRVIVVEGEWAGDDPHPPAPTRLVNYSEPDEEPPAAPPRDLPSGTIIGGRYRIVALLGRGGMGEVYRADDLTLNQPVALKFLPKELAGDAAWLARLRREVRIARRVTHPNVCRVHDVEEADGECFISMEYVDGENLRSLLTRIGRFSPDKALDIARQLCAGVTAAHVRKVLLCDLKPENIMLDGRGRTVITDFGLAVPRDEVRRSDIRAGTPAYMAPEQLSGRGLTVRSDVYSLGEVLYELFTGQPAFRAKTPREFAAAKRRSAPAPPSMIVGDIDLAVERIILRCLEPDPHDRPASALSVLAALPGGDPLAAALAAGATPTPEWVAAATHPRAAHAHLAVAGLIGFLILLVIAFVLSPVVHPVSKAGLDKAPQVLAERARAILAQNEWPSVPAHEAFGFSERLDCPWYSPTTDGRASPRFFVSAPETDAIFWYQRALSPPISADPLRLVFSNGRATLHDPWPTIPGTTQIVLTASGRFLGLESVPVVRSPATEAGTALDWAPVLSEAGLADVNLVPTYPRLTPRVGDVVDRRAWLGRYPDSKAMPIRIEAAASGGVPLTFAVLNESAGVTDEPDVLDYLRRRSLVGDVRLVLVTALVVLGIPLAWRNLRRGRGDVRGAVRLAAFVLALRSLAWLLQAPHTAALKTEFKLIQLAAAGAIAEAALVVLFYLALEPIVRRFWPHTLIAWTRILAGRIRDPFVGLNILMGALLGAFWAVVTQSEGLVAQALGLSIRTRLRPEKFFLPLMGPREALGFCLDQLRVSLYDGLFLLLLVALLRAATRRRWLTVASALLLILPMFVPRGSHPVVSLVLIGLGGVVLGLYLLTRFGLVPLVTALFVNQVLQRLPLTLDTGKWYADLSLFAVLVTAAVAAFGYFTARARTPGAALRPLA